MGHKMIYFICLKFCNLINGGKIKNEKKRAREEKAIAKKTEKLQL